MADRPIIFSGPMVRALLEGRKTMTRRLAWRDPDGGLLKRTIHNQALYRPSPWQRVKPGDRLWVRECVMPAIDAGGGDWRYAADYDAEGVRSMAELQPWRPSVHCPRGASRLTLIVTATKIERLQAISDADAQAEGVVEDDGSEPDIWYVPGAAAAGWTIQQASRPSLVFPSLWRSLHGADSWNANPEVVAIAFTVENVNLDLLARAA